ncbi:MAG: dTDP-4-dehydrorhamnose 3,5-epimerase [Pseudomonadota bacterium]
MKVTATTLPGVFVADTEFRGDHRGFFGRLFCADELQETLGSRQIVQVNFSRTEARGAVRGMHYQRPPQAETKFVRCLRGRVFDVAVDLRSGSPTFLHWHAEELSADNHRMMVIPEGCAHGFQALEAGSELLYLHTATYAPDLEGGVAFDDPRLAIAWPLPVTDLSVRDRQHSPLHADFSGISL